MKLDILKGEMVIVLVETYERKKALETISDLPMTPNQALDIVYYDLPL